MTKKEYGMMLNEAVNPDNWKVVKLLNHIFGIVN